MHRLCGTPIFPIKRNRAEWSEMFNINKESNKGRKAQWKSYAFSKLATAMLAVQLNRVSGVRAVAINPGSVRTRMTDSVGISSNLRNKLNFLSRFTLSPVIFF